MQIVLEKSLEYKEGDKMPESKQTINIMHISDIHCGIGNIENPEQRMHRNSTINAFHRDFNEIPDDWKPDIIAITGDLGWSGCKSDYREFGNFFEKLINEAEVKRENVICCPGNHDKYLPKEQVLSPDIIGATDYYDINSVWDNQKILAEDFKYYSSWLRNLKIVPLENNSKLQSTKYLYGYREIEGVGFIVLNSAWLCDWRKDSRDYPDADRNHLMIDNSIINAIVENRRHEIPVIAMYHHPNEWLKTDEIQRRNNLPCTIDSINKNADIILNGHTHHAMDEHPRQRLHYIAGTINANDTYNSECFILKMFINKENFKLTKLNDARYYSRWDQGEVAWHFEEHSTSICLDTKEQEKYMEELEKDLLPFRRLKESIQKELEPQPEMEKHFRDLISALQKDINYSELDLNHVLKVIYILGEFVFSDAVKDADKNEHTRRLIKSSEHTDKGGDQP